MLDSFEVISTSGIVLWSKSYVQIAPSVVNNFVKDVFIEERIVPAASGEASDSKPVYKKEGYTLKWTTAKDLGLIFVAVYQSLIHLTWIDKLLENVRALFVDLYGSQLRKSDVAVVSCPFDDYFDRQVQRLEPGHETGSRPSTQSSVMIDVTPPSSRGNDRAGAPPLPPGLLKPSKRAINEDNVSSDATPLATPDHSRPSSPAVNHLLTAKGGPGGRTSRRSRKATSNTANLSAPVSSGDEGVGRKSKRKSGGKQMRKWDADGLADEDNGPDALDFSAPTDSTNNEVAEGYAKPGAVDHGSWGQRTGRGEFVLKDLDDEMDSILASAEEQKAAGATSSGLVGSSLGAIGGLFRNVVGGKTLTKEDLAKSMKGMEDHLLRKNVAREAAVRLCESVERELAGGKTGSFTSVEKTIRAAMESALRKILTPTSSLDLLRDIESIRHPPKGSPNSGRPYVMSIVGVNGVGKSTNLSKICFFLLQNKYRVLIVAADTFRSGAVEQLRVHARNLRELSAREGGAVDLYERGYGKDAAHIARDAVSFAAEQSFDVVLIDTAGRRHNDARLMSSLEKFAALARPDKILMVGEALVGTDSVQQARNFNAAFGATRKLDGFIISKCDTVGDMVGTLVSMVHATGIPVLFLGTGQHYSDLRTLSVPWAVRLLMS